MFQGGLVALKTILATLIILAISSTANGQAQKLLPKVGNYGIAMICPGVMTSSPRKIASMKVTRSSI